MHRCVISKAKQLERYFLPPLLVVLTSLACGNGEDEEAIVDLGELTEEGLRIAYDLAPGESTPLHQLTAAADTVIVTNPDGEDPPTVTLEVSVPGEEEPDTRSASEPTITIAIDSSTTIQLRLTNDDTEANARGTVTVELMAASTVSYRYEIDGYIVGDSLTDEEEARASWQAQCDAWVEARRELSGPDSVESHDCGTAVDINDVPTYYQFASAPTAMIVVELTRGLSVVETMPFHVEGEPLMDPTAAIRSWEEACSSRISTLRDQYGTRFLGANCIEPSDINNNESLFTYRSDLLVQLVSLPGAHASGSSYVLGVLSENVEEALNSWRDYCSSWLDDRLAASGLEHLESYECGEPRDIDPETTFFQFESEPTVTFALAEGELEESRTPTAEGTESSNVVFAVRAWEEACAEELDAAMAEHGELFVGGICPKPRDINPNDDYYRYLSDVVLYLAN